MNSRIHVTGQWEGAIFANAHNEWLNMLITGGIVGGISYFGIFISAWKQLWEKAEQNPIMVMGMMMMAGYMVNNVFGFQQIITTPIMFVVLGMLEKHCKDCESERKKYE